MYEWHINYRKSRLHNQENKKRQKGYQVIMLYCVRDLQQKIEVTQETGAVICLNHRIWVMWRVMKKFGQCDGNIPKILQRAEWREYAIMEKFVWGPGWWESALMKNSPEGWYNLSWVYKAFEGSLDSEGISEGALALPLLVNMGGIYHPWSVAQRALAQERTPFSCAIPYSWPPGPVAQSAL